MFSIVGRVLVIQGSVLMIAAILTSRWAAMKCIRQQFRPSWKQVFERAIYADPSIYSPMHHIHRIHGSGVGQRFSKSLSTPAAP
jgi:hypothetical protein